MIIIVIIMTKFIRPMRTKNMYTFMQMKKYSTINYHDCFVVLSQCQITTQNVHNIYPKIELFKFTVLVL